MLLREIYDAILENDLSCAIKMEEEDVGFQEFINNLCAIKPEEEEAGFEELGRDYERLNRGIKKCQIHIKIGEIPTGNSRYLLVTFIKIEKITPDTFTSIVKQLYKC